MTSAEPVVLEGFALDGAMNTDEATQLAQVRSAIRRGHPQLRAQGLQRDRICLVGGGPSLEDTVPELLDLVRDGAKLVTLNGAYHWALARNLIPAAQIVVDARPGNARFVDPPLPRCQYLLGSVCHPDLWDRVAGRDNVWIYHPFVRESVIGRELDAFYAGCWEPVLGGTTVATRALVALRMLGYLRFDLFGIDSCWMGAAHHAYAQPENDGDQQLHVRLAPPGAAAEAGREFTCAGWHVKQLEDFLRIIRAVGDRFVVTVHGDGMLAYALSADAEIVEQEAVPWA